jgi:Protein of unknown function (DUF3631)
MSMLDEFVAREDGPWAPWWGHDVEAGHYRAPAARLSRLLRPFGIEPKQLWLDGKNQRGYEAVTFKDAWERYLAPLPPARTLER